MLKDFLKKDKIKAVNNKRPLISKSDIVGSTEEQDVIKCKYDPCFMIIKSEASYHEHLVSYHGEDVDTS